jgi:hypothetical protein
MKFPEFEILHHSYRLCWASGQKFAEKLSIEGEEIDPIPDWQYYKFNLVFKAFDVDYDTFKQMCLEDTKHWKKGRVCTDPDKYDEYLRGVDFDFDKETEDKYIKVNLINNSGIDGESLFVEGYTQNFEDHIQYIEKFDVFWYRDYIQYNPTTIGILQHIDELKNGVCKGITAPYSQFYNCLRALHYFWD